MPGRLFRPLGKPKLLRKRLDHSLPRLKVRLSLSERAARVEVRPSSQLRVDLDPLPAFRAANPHRGSTIRAGPWSGDPGRAAPGSQLVVGRCFQSSSGSHRAASECRAGRREALKAHRET